MPNALPKLVAAAAAGFIALGAAVAQDASPAASPGAQGEPMTFTSIFGEPLQVTEPGPDETFTAQVEEFHVTGENPYTGDQEAIDAGQSVYEQRCRSCHGAEARGGMGPSLVDETVRHERATTDKGLFEIIYGGASGAMPAFHDRLPQDDMLRVMAYLESLGAQ